MSEQRCQTRSKSPTSPRSRIAARRSNRRQSHTPVPAADNFVPGGARSGGQSSHTGRTSSRSNGGEEPSPKLNKSNAKPKPCTPEPSRGRGVSTFPTPAPSNHASASPKEKERYISIESEIYAQKHLLDFNQSCLPDSNTNEMFVYAGMCIERKMTLGDLERSLQGPWNSNIETLVVCPATDHHLHDFISRVRENLSSITDPTEKFSLISIEVSERLGGEGDEMLVQRSKKDSEKLRAQANSAVVKIGDLRFGVCRHRAILFKVCCDAVGLESRLVQGDYRTPHDSGYHAWNIVMVRNKQKIMDTMHQPGTLYDNTHQKVTYYHRLVGNDFSGGGGMSVRAPSNPPWNIPINRVHVTKNPNGDRRELGSGGFGIVYVGRLDMVDTVAVKQLYPQYAYGYSEQFLNEVQILHELKHEHIITFKGAFMNSKMCVIVTELARGGDLASLIKHSPDLAVWNSHGLTIAWQVARALFHMHTLPIPVVHGDLKPQNVLLTETLTAKVADFGLSKLNRDEEMSAMQAFSPDFSAPEVLRQERGTAKIDIYSFGVILKQLVLLCGARNIKQREFPPECPTELRNLINACLSDDPTERPSAAELVKQVNRLRLDHCNSRVETPRRREAVTNGPLGSVQLQDSPEGGEVGQVDNDTLEAIPGGSGKEKGREWEEKKEGNEGHTIGKEEEGEKEKETKVARDKQKGEEVTKEDGCEEHNKTGKENDSSSAAASTIVIDANADAFLSGELGLSSDQMRGLFEKGYKSYNLLKHMREEDLKEVGALGPQLRAFQEEQALRWPKQRSGGALSGNSGEDDNTMPARKHHTFPAGDAVDVDDPSDTTQFCTVPLPKPRKKAEQGSGGSAGSGASSKVAGVIIDSKADHLLRDQMGLSSIQILSLRGKGFTSYTSLRSLTLNDMLGVDPTAAQLMAYTKCKAQHWPSSSADRQDSNPATPPPAKGNFGGAAKLSTTPSPSMPATEGAFGYVSSLAPAAAGHLQSAGLVPSQTFAIGRGYIGRFHSQHSSHNLTTAGYFDVPQELDKFLKENADWELSYVCLGPNDSFFASVSNGRMMKSRSSISGNMNATAKFKEALHAEDVDFVVFGANSTYFIQYDSGSARWCGLADKLSAKVQAAEGKVTHLALGGPNNKYWFVRIENRNGSWTSTYVLPDPIMDEFRKIKAKGGDVESVLFGDDPASTYLIRYKIK